MGLRNKRNGQQTAALPWEEYGIIVPFLGNNYSIFPVRNLSSQPCGLGRASAHPACLLALDIR